MAALAVVALHVSFYTARARAPWDLGDGLLQGLRLGVVLFFALSGFLLVRPWLAYGNGAARRPRVGAYLLRRAARVLPAYYAALLLAAAVLAGTGSARLARTADVPVLLLLRQNWFASIDGKLVPPAWTLGVEASFYVLLPLVGAGLASRWRSLPLRLAACSAAALCCIAFNGAIVLWLPGQWHRTLPGFGYAFALGIAAAAIVAERRPARAARAALLAVGYGLVAFDALGHVPWELPGRTVWSDVPAAFGCAAIIAAVASGPVRLLGSRPLRWLGTRSYGLFLAHYPVILLLATRGDLPEAPLSALVVVLGWSLAVADMLHRLVERPAMRAVERLVARRNGDCHPQHAGPRGAILGAPRSP